MSYHFNTKYGSQNSLLCCFLAKAWYRLEKKNRTRGYFMHFQLLLISSQVQNPLQKWELPIKISWVPGRKEWLMKVRKHSWGSVIWKILYVFMGLDILSSIWKLESRNVRCWGVENMGQTFDVTNLIQWLSTTFHAILWFLSVCASSFNRPPYTVYTV